MFSFKNVFIITIAVLLVILAYFSIQSKTFYDSYGTTQGEVGIVKIEIANYQDDISVLVNGTKSENDKMKYMKIEADATTIAKNLEALEERLKDKVIWLPTL